MHEVQETGVQSLVGEDPLEEEVATHSSILAWKIPWTEEPGGLQSIGLHGVRQDWARVWPLPTPTSHKSSPYPKDDIPFFNRVIWVYSLFVFETH